MARDWKALGTRLVDFLAATLPPLLLCASVASFAGWWTRTTNPLPDGWNVLPGAVATAALIATLLPVVRAWAQSSATLDEHIVGEVNEGSIEDVDKNLPRKVDWSRPGSQLRFAARRMRRAATFALALTVGTVTVALVLILKMSGQASEGQPEEVDALVSSRGVLEQEHDAVRESIARLECGKRESEGILKRASERRDSLKESMQRHASEPEYQAAELEGSTARHNDHVADRNGGPTEHPARSREGPGGCARRRS